MKSKKVYNNNNNTKQSTEKTRGVHLKGVIRIPNTMTLMNIIFFPFNNKKRKNKNEKKSHGGTNPHSTQYLFRYTYAWIICVFFRRGDITVFDQFFSEFVKENGKCTTTFTS